jgi:hypothetical protein
VDTAAEVVGRLTAMQAQEDRYARWSVAQRTHAGRHSAVEAALAQGAVLRTHVLRPTWHYVAARDLRWLAALSGPRVDRANARRYRELELDAVTLHRSNETISRALSSGARTRRELGAVLQAHGISTDRQRLAYLLMHAELSSVICSGPMHGAEHTYARFDDRVPAARGPEGEEALAELAWRYFSTRGPGTVSDFSWWSGLNAGEARQALAMVQPRLSSSVVDGRTYWEAHDAPARREQRIDLVQCYDEIIISYRQSRDILHTATTAFPVPRDIDGFRHVLLLDGRLLGHWLARAGRDGVRVETRTGVQLDDRQRSALARAVDRYQRFLREQATSRSRRQVRPTCP